MFQAFGPFGRIGRSRPVTLNLADQSLRRGSRVTDEKQDKNHGDEGNHASNDNDRVKRMNAGSLARIREVTNQQECNDRAYACARSAHTAYGGN